MILERNIFWEDEHSDSFSVINKYFNNIYVIEKENIHIGDIPKNVNKVRGTLLLLNKLHRLHNWTNALVWAPPLRDYMFSSDHFFIDANALINYNIEWPLFIRSSSGNKDFSGNVYTKEKFIIEYVISFTYACLLHVYVNEFSGAS